MQHERFDRWLHPLSREQSTELNLPLKGHSHENVSHPPSRFRRFLRRNNGSYLFGRDLEC